LRKLLLLIIVPLSLFGSAGKFLIVVGDVKVERDSKQVRPKSGDTLYSGDRVITRSGKTQVRLKEGTTISIGKRSVFKIDDYKFNKREKSIKLSVKKGLFSVITGRISKLSPEKFKLKTKTSTIGVRGTHFGGDIGDNGETIFCSRGEITVSLQNEKLSLSQGEMVKVENGDFKNIEKFLPEKFEHSESLDELLLLSPETLQRIENFNYTQNISVAKEDINQLFNVDEYRDFDDEVGILSLIAKQQIYRNSVEQLRENAGNKYDLSLYYPTDSEAVKSWGVYLKEELPPFSELLSGNYNVDLMQGDELPFIQEVLWVDNLDYTDYSTTLNRIGSFDRESMNSMYSWDGRSATREVVEFRGGLFGLLLDGSNLKTILNGSSSDFSMVVDFGSRLVYATGDNGDWKTQVGQIYSSGLSATGIGNMAFGTFKEVEEQESNLLSGYSNIEGDFFGESGNSVAGLFRSAEEREGVDGKELLQSYKDGSITSKEFYYSIDNQIAMFIADKSKSISLKKKEIDEDEYFSWGYWENENLESSELIPKHNRSGAWILSKENRTSKETLGELRESNFKASYSGEVFGTVQYPFENRETEEIQNGKIELDIDFGKNSINGAIEFLAGEDSWNIDVGKEYGYTSLNDLSSDTDFKFNNISHRENGDVVYDPVLFKQVTFEAGTVEANGEVVDRVNSFEGNGNFYGESAERFGGGFSAGTENGKYAVGSFKGER